MRKYLIGITLFIFALSLPCLHAMASDSPSIEIVEAAKEGLLQYEQSPNGACPCKVQ